MAFGSAVDESLEAKPAYLIIRNFPKEVFTENRFRDEFEMMFKSLDSLKLTYLPSFHRVIVAFDTMKNALFAQSQLNNFIFHELPLKVFLKEEAKKLGEEFLALPKAEKLFLISPPASPPVGWEPIEEPIPVVNYDLLSAIAHLEEAGKPVELLSSADDTPSIIVVGCEDPVSRTGKDMISMANSTREELQTKRPPFALS